VTNGVDYAWLVGLVVAGLVYFLLSRSLDLGAEQSAIEASERELQAIDVAETTAITGQAPGDVQAP
jgi:NCS1 family nucleobase:cation symporter-1